MNFTPLAALLTGGLFVGMVALMELGRRIGLRRLGRHSGEALGGAGAIEASVFALLGLLIAFTFSGAASRFDARRALIVAETNHIGTAYLRLDVLPASAQPALRESFRRYVDSRLAAYRVGPDMAAVRAELARGGALQQEIWRQAVAASRAADSQPAAAQLLSALNAMIDITTTRTMAMRMHPPAIVFVMLFALALVSALLGGYGMASAKAPSWLHMLGFAAVMALSVYVILDLEFPRLGLIRVDAFDDALVELRRSLE